MEGTNMKTEKETIRVLTWLMIADAAGSYADAADIIIDEGWPGVDRFLNGLTEPVKVGLFARVHSQVEAGAFEAGGQLDLVFGASVVEWGAFGVDSDLYRYAQDLAAEVAGNPVNGLYGDPGDHAQPVR
jgi:hypothetical protein